MNTKSNNYVGKQLLQRCLKILKGLESTGSFYTIEANDLQSALEICLDLRGQGLWAFRGQRNKSWDVGLHYNKNWNKLEEFLEQFRRRCMEFPPPQHINESDDWRWLFFAQHHGLRTKLLDWTKDPLIAIYFAVEKIISRINDKKICGAIWALHVNKNNFIDSEKLINPKDIPEWGLVNPPPFTPRLARQSGLFIYNPAKKRPVPINLITRRDGEILIKIEIVPKKKGQNPTALIRKQLGILNVHHGSLFPDPDGVADFINHEWSFLQKVPKN